MNCWVELIVWPFSAVITSLAWIPEVEAGEPEVTLEICAPPVELPLSSTPT